MSSCQTGQIADFFHNENLGTSLHNIFNDIKSNNKKVAFINNPVVTKKRSFMNEHLSQIEIPSYLETPKKDT